MRGRNAFDEVRSILGRLDESITEARRRRLGDDAEAPDDQQPRTPTVPGQGPQHALNGNGHAHSNGPTPTDDLAIGGQAPEEPISPRRAQYGKARPIRPLSGAAHDHHEQPRRTA